MVVRDNSGHIIPHLDMEFMLGNVIAWNYCTPDDSEEEVFGVLFMVREDSRIPNVRNYGCCELTLSEIRGGVQDTSRNIEFFPNIVPAVDAYRDEYNGAY